MLMLGAASAGAPEWTIPVVGTSAVTGEGLDDLIDAIARHRRIAFESETGRRRRIAVAAFRLRKTAEDLLLARFGDRAARAAAPLAARLAGREGDPYSLADELINSAGEGRTAKENAHEPDARSKIA
jgi:LAO/AO transport system kinase